MMEVCQAHFTTSDVAVLAAAVADYKPSVVAKDKIKKDSETLHLDLIRTPDIAASLGKQKRDDQILVGFALETNDGEANAFEKMKKKNMDMIVLNNPYEEGSGFGHDTNKVTFLYPDNKRENFELKSKKDVAGDIVGAVNKIMNANAKN